MYSLEEVATHSSLDSGIWVTYDDDIFDITDFVRAHPGGNKIMLAAGKSIEPFWNLYTVHKTSEIKEILYTMRIGKLNQSASIEQKKKLSDATNPYNAEPKRHPAFQVNSLEPFDAETPTELLTHSLRTPNELFYVRNHLPVPDVNPENYELEIVIPGREPLKLSLDELKTRFPKHSVVVTLQCAGNRRGEMQNHRQITGAKAGHTAISTAEWAGAKLSDVLRAAGLPEQDDINEQDVAHVQLEALDKDMSGEAYGTSIPMEKSNDVLLAYEMNGAELPRDHGYPVRAVVPGMIGARSVKWVARVVASNGESNSFYQTLDYKVAPPWAKHGDWDFRHSAAINESPVNSAICSPSEGANIDDEEETVTVRGYAYSGGGNGILRVDVSSDGGTSWHEATLEQEKQRRYQQWAWALWEAEVPVAKKGEKMQLVCKAIDTHHNVQPEALHSIWNLRGFLNNAWHRVNVKSGIDDNNNVGKKHSGCPI